MESPPPHHPSPLPPRQKQFPCQQCGASLVFEPGHDSMKCPYCGSENQLAVPTGAVRSLDFVAQLDALAVAEPEHVIAVKCNGCGAETTLPPDTTAGVCPFCASPIVAEASTRKAIRPQSLLPFAVTKQHAGDCFRTWVAGLWFAPNALAASAQRSTINGAYLPAWTYDSDTDSAYIGQRGDDYWETETYTETDANGNTVTRERQVLRTRWTYVNGNVANRFDNILIMATTSLPAKHLDHLAPWDLDNLVPYADEYLSGFVAESYQVSLADGFQQAQQVMDADIRKSVIADIGGDHQQIGSVQTQYENIGFKHLLLPVWISAYRYQNQVYRFLVNARTGEVRGERPYSAIKIAMLILAILIVILLVFMRVNR